MAIEKQPKVLLVEDELGFQEAIAQLIRSFGMYEVLTASNGVEALKILEEHGSLIGNEIKCVFMDIKMPEMDGILTLREWRRKESFLKKIPVIMMTAYEDVDKWEALEPLDICGYLKKPVDKNGLEKMLDEIVIQKHVKEMVRNAKYYAVYRRNQLMEYSEELTIPEEYFTDVA